MLVAIKDTKDNLEQRAVEAEFLEFREQSPSDAFLAFIIQEIVTESEVQELASVLLKSDIEKNKDKSSIYRLSQQQQSRPAMLQLLQFIAEKPDMRLVQIIASYALNEFDGDRPFDELFEFVLQGFQSKNAKVREMITLLISNLCEQNVKLLEDIKFDFLSFL